MSGGQKAVALLGDGEPATEDHPIILTTLACGDRPGPANASLEPAVCTALARPEMRRSMWAPQAEPSC